jgi:molybdopterin synthase catalytic subunit
LEDLCGEHPFQKAAVLHRVGFVPVGEVAILVEVQSAHRGEAFAVAAQFMDRLKKDVPIWKIEAK